MSLAELKTLLEGTGFQVAYMHFTTDDPPSMPFVTYYQPATNNFAADGRVYRCVKHIYITLWTEKRDEISERKLTDILDANDIPWSRTENYLEDEKCYEIIYEVEV